MIKHRTKTGFFCVCLCVIHNIATCHDTQLAMIFIEKLNIYIYQSQKINLKYINEITLSLKKFFFKKKTHKNF